MILQIRDQIIIFLLLQNRNGMFNLLCFIGLVFYLKRIQKENQLLIIESIYSYINNTFSVFIISKNNFFSKNIKNMQMFQNLFFNFFLSQIKKINMWKYILFIYYLTRQLLSRKLLLIFITHKIQFYFNQQEVCQHLIIVCLKKRFLLLFLLEEPICIFFKFNVSNYSQIYETLLKSALANNFYNFSQLLHLFKVFFPFTKNDKQTILTFFRKTQMIITQTRQQQNDHIYFTINYTHS
ncbi:hypothetical protein ABPG72_015088 [Tetrahymena utriculariae]